MKSTVPPQSNLDLYSKVSKHLGLSEYETSVYVSLVNEGASEARKLSMMCGVPRTKVYPTLTKLVERGLVFEIPGEPRKFAPVSPVEAFKTCMQHFREETSEMICFLAESSKVISSLEEVHKKTYLTVKPQKEDVWIVEGRLDVFRKVREMMARAKKSVDVVTTENGLVLFYRAVDKLIDKLVESGVNVQIGTRINSHNGHLVRELNYVCRVTHVNVCSPFLFLCVDGRECLLAELAPDNLDVDSGKDRGVISQNPDVCGLISLILPRSTREVLSRKVNELSGFSRMELLKQHVG